MNSEFLRRQASRPSVVVFCLLAGAATGRFFPGFAGELGQLSSIYLALLKMVVLPFMVSAIIFSIHRLLREGAAGPLLGRLVLLFLGVLLLAGCIGLFAAQLVAPGEKLPPETLQQLGRLVGQGGSLSPIEEIPLHAPLAETPLPGFGDLLLQLIPDNIFAALAQGETLKAFLFALLFGCALSQVPARIADTLSDTMETIFHACQTMTRWFNYFLPPVLFAMIASQTARTGLEPLQAMLGFLLALLLGSAILIALSLLALRYASALPWRSVLASQREPMTMALATRNSQACMPAMIEALVERLGFPHYRIELLVPLGVSLLRAGPVLYFALATTFIAQLYDRSLTPGDLGVIVLASTLAGFASTGMSGLLVLSLVGLVCGFLALPAEAALVLFVAVEPVCDTLRTLVGVAINGAAAAVLCGRQTGMPH